MSGVSIPVLATSVFLTAFSAFGAGYLMSPPPVRTGDSRPIIDPDAWNRTAPVPSGFQAQANPAQVEIAMNAAADDLNQRGWVQPEEAQDISYQDEVRSLDASDGYDSGSYTVEPLEGASANGDQGSASIQVLDKAEADRAWDSWPTASNNNQQQINATPISASH